MNNLVYNEYRQLLNFLSIKKHLAIFIVGDVHNEWESVIEHIKCNVDCLYIFVGDIPMLPQDKDSWYFLPKLAGELDRSNNYAIVVRGNHDDPDMFPGLIGKNILLVEDYTYLNLITFGSTTKEDEYFKYLFVGGAVSVDRHWQDTKKYFSHERVTYEPAKCNPVDTTDDLRKIANGYGYSGQLAETLAEDINTDRMILNRVLFKTKPKLHYYGHFHCSDTSVGENGTQHIMLDIAEIKKLSEKLYK